MKRLILAFAAIIALSSVSYGQTLVQVNAVKDMAVETKARLVLKSSPSTIVTPNSGASTHEAEYKSSEQQPPTVTDFGLTNCTTPLMNFSDTEGTVYAKAFTTTWARKGAVKVVREL